jgi:hypothetical protein
MLGVTLISLAAQHRKGTANFIVFDASPPGSPAREFLERAVQSLPHDVVLAKPTDVATVMTELAPELDRRADPSAGGEHPTIYVIVHGLPRFRGLKQEDEFSMSLDAAAGPQPGAVFTRLLSEGPSLGCHVICTCDTLNNLNRFVSRKMITEFERRVLFQMSDNDSATLIDSSAAGSLGLHRALLYNAQEGSTETFRPYALPDNQWLEESSQSLKRLVG